MNNLRSWHFLLGSHELIDLFIKSVSLLLLLQRSFALLLEVIIGTLQFFVSFLQLVNLRLKIGSFCLEQLFSHGYIMEHLGLLLHLIAQAPEVVSVLLLVSLGLQGYLHV